MLSTNSNYPFKTFFINGSIQLAQGIGEKLTPLQKKVSGKYKIISRHYDTNGSLPKGAYRAIYYARYTGDRSGRIAGVIVKDARIGVFPSVQPSRKTIKI